MASGPERPDAARRDFEAYLLFEAVRWPEGPSSCPHCGTDGRCRLLAAPDGIARPTRTGRPTGRRVWRCGACRRQFSVLTGTVFERTRVPLPRWLEALRALSGPADDTSPAALAQAVGVSLDTARQMTALVRTTLSASAEVSGVSRQLQG